MFQSKLSIFGVTHSETPHLEETTTCHEHRRAPAMEVLEAIRLLLFVTCHGVPLSSCFHRILRDNSNRKSTQWMEQKTWFPPLRLSSKLIQWCFFFLGTFWGMTHERSEWLILVDSCWQLDRRVRKMFTSDAYSFAVHPVPWWAHPRVWWNAGAPGNWVSIFFSWPNHG